MNDIPTHFLLLVDDQTLEVWHYLSFHQKLFARADLALTHSDSFLLSFGVLHGFFILFELPFESKVGKD